MDFFQCLGVTWASGSWCLLTTRARGSLCSGAGQGGDTEVKLLQEAVLPGDTVDTSSESKMMAHYKMYIEFFVTGTFVKNPFWRGLGDRGSLMLILDNDTVRPSGKCPCEVWPGMIQSGIQRRGHL